MQLPTLYGIRNCNKVRQARSWLDGRGIEYRFHDFKTDGLEPALLGDWIARCGWETLINRRGQTWRRLDAEVRNAIDAQSAERIMLMQPSIIRRPVLDTGAALHLGFSESDYANLFGPDARSG